VDWCLVVAPQSQRSPADNEFILVPGFQLLSADSLPIDMRLRGRIGDDDVALTVLGGRHTSVVIAAELGRFLEEFRQPSTVIEAIIRYALKLKTDPLETFDEFMPALQRLMREGYLIPSGTKSPDRLRPTFRRGDRLEGWEILSCVQYVEDSEVYCGRRDGLHVAIKTLRPDMPAISDALEREAAILRHLRGSVAPSLVDQGETRGIPYLVMDWREGVPCTTVADECRSTASEGRLALASLCTDIARVYASLHSMGVVHGDIHPNNVLIGSSRRVSLVDFGLAIGPGQPISPRRGGIGFFYEPEFALARLAASAEPDCTTAGEQYAVAALLYLLITGSHYVEFSLLERDALLQIRDAAPMPFIARGIEEWPLMEATLAKAMSKRPDDRYESMAEFAKALDQVTLLVSPGSGHTAISPQTMRRHPLVTSLLARTRPQAQLFTSLHTMTAPRASLFYGSGGIAYGLYRMGCLRGDSRELRIADLWLQRAYKMAESEDGFLNSEYGVIRERVAPSSPFHGMAGLHAIQALLSDAMGDLSTRYAAICKFIDESDLHVTQLDLTLGRAGTLLAAALIFDSSRDDAASQARLIELGDAVLAELIHRLQRAGPIASSRDLDYLGIAHGWGGVLFAALRWCEVTERALTSELRERLSELTDCGEPSGRGLRWPVKNACGDPAGEEGYLAGWCNGSAGFAQLWCLASQLSGDDEFLELATRAAWNAWETPNRLSNLCCGTAGVAYALLMVGLHTGDAKWSERARRLAAHVIDDSTNAPFYDSLYKGTMGHALALYDLGEPETAAMPFFSREYR
jgi:eukaryotic-like serine/threonine-protein kinase